ncbi:MAG TPA: helix-turn-helix domain-containing protein [Pseudonocardiaceae bacterium]
MTAHRHTGTLPITLAELARIAPLARASSHELANSARRVEQVILAETFDRLRRSTPHALIVLHAEAATGGWSLAAALHLAWERNAAAVVVAESVVSPAGAELARRLSVNLFAIAEDPVDVALQLAGQVSAPRSARALRQVQCAERLASETSLRGVLTLLNNELDGIPVALQVGEAVVAGRAAAVNPRGDATPVCVEVSGSERAWGTLVAAVPAAQGAMIGQVEALLGLARPALAAAWAQTRLNVSLHAAHEQAAFELLRRQASEAPTEPTESSTVEHPVDAAWISELGWQVNGYNRAVWIAPIHTNGQPPDELGHLVRVAWQRGRPTWPLVADGDGWISWHSGGDPDDTGPLRRAIVAFRETATAHRLALGVGRAHSGVGGLMRSVTEARLAAHVAGEQGPAAVQWFDEVGPSAALAWLPVAELTEVAHLCLGDLIGAKDQAALVETVLAVLDCGGSLSQASQRLGVHRNTVLARLARARQVGMAFEEPGQRLALHVLCYALASQTDVATPEINGAATSEDSPQAVG